MNVLKKVIFTPLSFPLFPSVVLNVKKRDVDV